LGSYPIACRKQSLKHPYHFTTIKGGGHGLGPEENDVLQSIFKWIKKEVSCGNAINACELFTVPNTAACSSVPTCPLCTATPANEISTEIIKLYPNPFENQLKIELQTKFYSERLSLRVTDIVGRSFFMIYTRDGNTITLPTSNLKTGTYFVEIIHNLKVIKRLKAVKIN
jgi:hypothetical protein